MPTVPAAAAASASASASPFVQPQGRQHLPDVTALQYLNQALSTTSSPLPRLLASLDAEVDTERTASSVNLATARHSVLSHHAAALACLYFSGDFALTYRVLHMALVLFKNQNDLLWGHLRDVFSPISRTNVLTSTSTTQDSAALDAVRGLLMFSPPSVATSLGAMDYVTCTPSRSILSPPAYLVDLLRLISNEFKEAPDATPADQGASRFLRFRRPDIYDLLLSPENTFDTIPYLDIVNDALAAIVLNNYNQKVPPGQRKTSAYDVLSTQIYPFNLPFHRPRQILHGTLHELKLPLHTIVRATTESSLVSRIALSSHPDVAVEQPSLKELQEILGLSEEEWHLLTTPSSDPSRVMHLYGVTASSGSGTGTTDSIDFLREMSKVDYFMSRTHLDREQLQQLLFQDLSDAEIAIGQSGVFFVNDIDDGKSHLAIRQIGNEYEGVTEEIVNLSWGKLDRIQRFLRLANRLNWSYADLDWALHAIRIHLHQTNSSASQAAVDSRSLLFDGLNDYIAVQLEDNNQVSFFAPDTLTIEAWVYPLEKDASYCTDASMLHQMLLTFWQPTALPDDGDLGGDPSDDGESEPTYDASWTISLNKASQLCVGMWGGTNVTFITDTSLQKDRYFHICVKIRRVFSGEERPIEVFINGREQTGVFTGYDIDGVVSANTDGVEGPTKVPQLAIPRSLPFLAIGQSFRGFIKDVRLWNVIRNTDDVSQSMFKRLSGFEYNLIAYWPLRSSVLGQILDYSKYAHSGKLGDNNHFSVPRWGYSKLLIEPARKLAGLYFRQSDEFDSSIIADLSQGRLSSKGATSFIFSLWIKADDGLDHEEIVSVETKSTKIVLALGQQEGKKSFYIHFVQSDNALPNKVVYDFQISSNDLYHVTFSVAEKNIGLSVRPGNDSSPAIEGTLDSLGDPIPLGLTVGKSFSGLIHDLKLWSTKSSIAEFDSLMLDEQDLNAHWPLSSISTGIEEEGYCSPNVQGVGMDLIGKKRNDFSPSVISSNSTLQVGDKAIFERTAEARKHDNPGILMSMDAKSSVSVVLDNKFGLGQMNEGVIGFWCKCPETPVFDHELLFAHGNDDVGLSICIDRKRTLSVIPWAREYDAIRRRFGKTVRYPLVLGTGKSAVLPGGDDWNHIALSFAENMTGDKDVRIGSYRIEVLVNEVTIGDFNNVPLPPTGTLLLGGIPDDSSGWIVFDDKEGAVDDFRQDLYFSGSLLDLKIWTSALKNSDSEILLEKPLLMSVIFDDILDSDSTEYSEFNVSVETNAEKFPCYPRQASARLYRNKNVLVTTGDSVQASAYSFCKLPGSEWSNYSVGGRLQCETDSSGVGVILSTSRKTHDDGIIYRDGAALVGVVQGSAMHFKLKGLSTAASDIPADSDLVLHIHKQSWFQFKLLVTAQENNMCRVDVKLWNEDGLEPADILFARSFEGMVPGEIGIWGFGLGEKLFDDILIKNTVTSDELLFEDFEGKEQFRRGPWVDFETDKVDFAAGQVDFEPLCFGWNVKNQEVDWGDVIKQRRVVVPSPAAANLLQSWQRNDVTTTVSGRFMFENDGSEIGVYFGVGPDLHTHSWALVRAPFDTQRKLSPRYGRVAQQISDAFLFRLECPKTNEWIDIAGLTPVHNRWYGFKVAFSDVQGTDLDTKVQVKVWEFGRGEPENFSLTKSFNVARGDNEFIGLMGSRTGRKYFADIRSDSGNVAVALDLQSTTWRAAFDSYLEGFGKIQPNHAIVGATLNDGVETQSLFCPEFENEEQRWVQAVSTKDYTVTGSVYCGSPETPFGFAVYSRIPIGENRFYRISCTPRDPPAEPQLRILSGFGDRIFPDLQVDNASLHLAVATGWYHFRVSVRGGFANECKGKVWRVDVPEPEDETFVFIDASGLRPESGAFGVWGTAASTSFQDLRLEVKTEVNDVTTDIANWNQFLVTQISRFFVTSRVILENQTRFSHVIDADGKSQISFAPGIVDRFEETYAVTSLHTDVGSDVTLTARVQISSPGAEAGFLFFGNGVRSERIGVVVRANSTRNGVEERGSFYLSRRPTPLLSRANPFYTLGASTERRTSSLDFPSGGIFNVRIEVRTVLDTSNSSLLRIRAVAWPESDPEPRHFSLVGYCGVLPGRFGFGLYGSGEGSKTVSHIRMVHIEDMLPSGNEVKPVVSWVNVSPFSEQNEPSSDGIFSQTKRADKSAHYLRNDAVIPLLSCLELLKFSGKGQHLSTSIDGFPNWVFRASIPNGKGVGPVLHVPDASILLQVVNGMPSPTLTLEYGDGKTLQLPVPGDEDMFSRVVLSLRRLRTEEEELRLSVSGQDSIAVTRMAMKRKFSAVKAYVGRKDVMPNEQAQNFVGFMFDIILLGGEVHSGSWENVYLSHASLGKREARRNNLLSSWPVIRKNSFLSGGDAVLWSPKSVIQDFLKPLVSQDPTFISQQSVLWFPEAADSAALLLSKHSDIVGGDWEVRTASVNILFWVMDVLKHGKKQFLYQEGLMSMYVMNGMLHFEVGDVHFESEICSREWYSGTLVWNSSKDVRTGALACYLNGFPVAIKRGKLYEATVPVVRKLGSNAFQGSILSLSVFYSALSRGEVLNLRNQDMDLTSRSDLVAHVHAGNVLEIVKPDSWTASMVTVRSGSMLNMSNVLSIPFAENIKQLAHVHDLVTCTGMNVQDAVLTWGPIKEYGRANSKPTKFDEFFNKRETAAEYGVWSFGMNPIRWSIEGSTPSDWISRLRLKNAVQASNSELPILIETSEPSGSIDGPFLTRVLNVSRLASVVKVSLTHIGKFLEILQPRGERYGPGEVVVWMRLFERLKSVGFKSEDLLYHMGLSEQTRVTEAQMFELSAVLSGDANSFSVTNASFENDDLSTEEVSKLIIALTEPTPNAVGELYSVIDHRGVVIPPYFSSSASQALRENPEWIFVLKKALQTSFQTEYHNVLKLKGLEDADLEFGSAGILLEALYDLGFVLGHARYKLVSTGELRTALETSMTPNFSLSTSVAAQDILTFLAQELLPKWVRKVRKLESTLIRNRVAMEEALYDAVGSMFTLNPSLIDIVMTSGFGGPAFEVAQGLLALSASDSSKTDAGIPALSPSLISGLTDTKERVASCIMVANLLDSARMVDDEVRQFVKYPIRFGVEEPLSQVSLRSLASLSEYAEVRDYLVQLNEQLGDMDADSTVGALVTHVVGLDAGKSDLSRLFKLRESDIALVFNKLAEANTTHLGTRTQLWFLRNVKEMSEALSSDVQGLWDMYEVNNFESYTELIDAVTESLRTENPDSYEEVEKRVLDGLLASSRDALLGLAISIIVPDARKYDLASIALGEYLLLDVSTGPAVLASRVQQAIQSVQLYIHRTLLGLERTDKNLTKENVEYVRKQWSGWLQNYRVWEAARRVYLYPENYIEPELRIGASAEFNDLAAKVSGGADDRAIKEGVLAYVESVGEVLSNLRIAGAGYSTTSQRVERTLTDSSTETNVDVNDVDGKLVERLMLVGKTRTIPYDTFVRQRIARGVEEKWLPWEKLDQPISAQWISPAFAFGKLYLFWVYWVEEQAVHYVFKTESDRRDLQNFIDGELREDRFIQDSSRLQWKRNENGLWTLSVQPYRKDLRGLPPYRAYLSFVRKLQAFALKNRLVTDETTVIVIEKGFLDDNFKKHTVQDKDSNFYKNWAEKDPKFETKGISMMRPDIQYVSQRVTGSWTSPQSITIPNVTVIGDVKISAENIPGLHRTPAWQRPYCLRLKERLNLEPEEGVENEPFVLVPSESSIGYALQTPVAIEKEISFDVHAKISSSQSDEDLKVYRDRNDGKGLVETETPGTQLELLHTKHFSFSLAMDRHQSFESVLPLIEEANSNWQVHVAPQIARAFSSWTEINGLRQSYDEKFEDGSTFYSREKDKWISNSGFSKAIHEALGGLMNEYNLTNEELQINVGKNPNEPVGMALEQYEEAWSKVQSQREKLNGNELYQKTEDDELSDSDISDVLLEWRRLETRHTELQNTATSLKSDFQVWSTGIMETEHYGPVLRLEWDGRSVNLPQPVLDHVLGEWAQISLTVKLSSSEGQASVVKVASQKVASGTVISEDVDRGLIEGLQVSSGSLGTLFEVGRPRKKALGSNDGQGPFDSFVVTCELSEARIWNVFGIQTTRNGVPTIARRLRPGELDDGLISSYPLNSSVRLRRDDGFAEFRRTNNLAFALTSTPPPEFSAERVLIILNGHVTGLESKSKQPFNAQLSRSVVAPSLSFVMKQDDDFTTPGSIISVVRSKPNFFAEDGSEWLDMYSGQTEYGIDPKKVAAMMATERASNYFQIRPESGDSPIPSFSLLGNITWGSSTVQPVQNLYGAAIIETDQQVFLLEAMPRGRTLRDTVSDYVKLTLEGDLFMVSMDRSNELKRAMFAIDKFKLQRISSTVTGTFQEILTNGGLDSLFSRETQKVSEKQVMWDGNSPELRQITTASVNVYPVIGSSAILGKPTAVLDIRTNTTVNDEFNQIDFAGVNGLYFWELFMHIPVLIANNLNAAGEYLKAMQWFEYIYQPIGNDLSTQTPNPWIFNPFEKLHGGSIDKVLSILGNEADVEKFRTHPFDAHNIASSRQFAYQKSIFMKTVSNIVDFGDALFIDDRESINQALLYYFQAAKILGKKPREVPRGRQIENTTPRTVEVLRFENTAPIASDFVVPRTAAKQLDPIALMISFCVPENDSLLQLWTRLEDRLYKIRNSLNIDGIFRQLDLFAPPIDPAALVSAVAGGSGALAAAAQLQTPVPHYRFNYMLNVAIQAVEAASAMGMELLAALESKDAEALAVLEADLAITLHSKRIQMSDKAVLIAEYEHSALEIARLRLVSKRERLNLYLENEEKFEGQRDASTLGVASKGLSLGGDLTKMSQKYKEREVNNKKKKYEDDLEKEVNKALNNDENKKEVAKQRIIAGRNFKVETRKRSNAVESAAAAGLDSSRKLTRQNASRDLHKKLTTSTAESSLRGSAGVVNLVPEASTGIVGFAPSAEVKFGGEKLAKGLEIAADVISIVTTAVDFAQSIAALSIEKESDKHGWEIELNGTNNEILVLDEQLEAAKHNYERAQFEQELTVLEKARAQQMYSALSQKFTNQELYAWLSNELKRMYRRTYNVAVQMARRAERCLQYELPTDDKFISGKGWQEVRNGLLATKVLQAELRQMDNHRLEQNSRFLEIERRVSLKKEAPDKFRELIRNGRVEFEFKESMFDKDFPGHYFRVLKTVAVTVIPSGGGAIEGKANLQAILTQTSNRVVMKPEVQAVRYLISGSDIAPNTTVMRTNWRANQSVALSKWKDDTGMFVVNQFFDARYFTFEGTGAVSSWELVIDESSNELLAEGVSGEVLLPALDFDADDNVDIVFTLQYSSKADYGTFKREVVELVKAQQAGG